MKFRRKRRSRRGRKKRNTLSKKVNKLSQFVYKTIEHKQATYVNSIANGSNEGTITDTNWQFVELTRFRNNATGATNETRVGNDITLSSIQFNLMFADWQASYVGRLIIVQYPNLTKTINQSNMADVLEFGLTDSSITPPVLEQHLMVSPYKVGSEQSFKILKDIPIRLHNGAASDATPNGQSLKYNIKLSKKTCPKMQNVISFKADTPGSVSPYKGNIVAYWRFSDLNTNVIGGLQKECYFTYRISYRDS